MTLWRSNLNGHFKVFYFETQKFVLLAFFRDSAIAFPSLFPLPEILLGHYEVEEYLPLLRNLVKFPDIGKTAPTSLLRLYLGQGILKSVVTLDSSKWHAFAL